MPVESGLVLQPRLREVDYGTLPTQVGNCGGPPGRAGELGNSDEYSLCPDYEGNLDQVNIRRGNRHISTYIRIAFH